MAWCILSYTVSAHGLLMKLTYHSTNPSDENFAHRSINYIPMNLILGPRLYSLRANDSVT